MEKEKIKKKLFYFNRLTGSSKDYVVIGSDSGKISILEFNDETNKFEIRHCETFGKTGCRHFWYYKYLKICI